VGVSVDAGGDLRLARDAGAGWAKLLALTGRRIDAATAERIGVVQLVTTRDELDATAMSLAREIAANAPLAVQSIKRTVNAFADRGLADALRFEAMSAAVEFVSEDMPAGYAARAAKQDVRFEGK
jgi:enoyl-CoA hydratase